MKGKLRASAGQDRASRTGPQAVDCHHPSKPDHSPSGLLLPRGASNHPGKLTYCTGELPRAFLEQSNDLGLLGGGTAATYHSRALAGQLHELVLIVLEANLAKRWGHEQGPRGVS